MRNDGAGHLAAARRIAESATRKAVATQNYELDGIDEIMFAFDQTCNLSCPSCRTHVITEKVSQSIDKARAVEQKLLPLLPSLRTLSISIPRVSYLAASHPDDYSSLSTTSAAPI